jgi:hypothetical protein
MRAAPDRQISLTDHDSRSMATSGQGSGIVGYNVQVAIDIKYHLTVVHDVINVGNNHSQLARTAKETKATPGMENLDVAADRGYFDSEEILACEEAGMITRRSSPPKASHSGGVRLMMTWAAASVLVTTAPWLGRGPVLPPPGQFREHVHIGTFQSNVRHLTMSAVVAEPNSSKACSADRAWHFPIGLAPVEVSYPT